MKLGFCLIFSVFVKQMIQTDAVCNEKLDRALIKDLQAMISRLKESGLRHSSCTNCPKFETPAFTATTSKSQFLTGPKHIAKFEKVWTNIGGGYSSHTGVFTVPRSGLYQISSTVMSRHGKNLHVHLWKNDIRIIAVYPGPGFHTGSASLALQLKKGDRVYIKHRTNNTEELYSDVYTYCVFSGFFISE